MTRLSARRHPIKRRTFLKHLGIVASLSPLGLDLMGHAAYRLRETDDVDSLAAQVPSDADGLLRFYERNFRRQGSFPVFEREL